MARRVRLEHQIESEYRGALQQQCYNERMLQVGAIGCTGTAQWLGCRMLGQPASVHAFRTLLSSALPWLPCLASALPLLSSTTSHLSLVLHPLHSQQQRYHYYGRREEARRMELKSCDELSRTFGSASSRGGGSGSAAAAGAARGAAAAGAARGAAAGQAAAEGTAAAGAQGGAGGKQGAAAAA